MQILIAWLGNTDVGGAREGNSHTSGPIAQALNVDSYDRLLLLSNQTEEDLSLYKSWLGSWSEIQVESVTVSLSDPTDFREIYLAATQFLDACLTGSIPAPSLTFHLSPGTPAMGAIWILLATTRYSARTIQSSPEQGVKETDIPFEISAEFIPKIMEAADRKLCKNINELPKEGAIFGDIIYKSDEMYDVIELAKKSALRNIPVIIDGETGTGKELLARAIHNASPRSSGPFVAINCGAIPRDLVESELFGSSKGSYSGAIDRQGHFENANEGTLFLDEIADLSLESQAKLLRVLEQREVTRIGESKTRPVNVRVIAASHINLIQAVHNRKFREDLLFRLLGITLTLPPLRDRRGDLGLLADRLLEQINSESNEQELEYVRKSLSPAAKNVLINYSWPGNVRELLSTLRRAALWSDNSKLSKKDMEKALMPSLASISKTETVLNRPMGQGFKVEEIRDDVVKHYLSRAIEETRGNKSETAKLLGLPNYQTVSYWIKKYDL